MPETKVPAASPATINYADLVGSEREMQLRSHVRHIMKHHGVLNGVLEADLVSMIIAASPSPAPTAVELYADDEPLSEADQRLIDAAWETYKAAAPATTAVEISNKGKNTMTDDQIKHMVERFLRWKLPENFAPDGGIKFTRDYNVNTPHPMKHEPVGTNLFDYTQAEAMIRHMLEGLHHG